ncbi:MAG: hypothetical protein IPP57_08705 [Candidatus Obscuribacter sp.]|jgi:hypothetical protein|nr:hypothetical protein [Candidatus Obscuribacter sp.]MBK7840129.1 hypothetical protein [Candidatus Obscuribacter sp.]MBK9770887.1 hypothetical protein [Candidatus Obscuribacter sp.]
MISENTATSGSKTGKRVKCFHSMSLSQVTFDRMVADPKYSDSDYLPAYRWAETRLGFFPLFLAVGTDESIGMTGYSNQWRRFLGNERDASGALNKVYRKRGEYPSNVLFVFDSEDIAEAVFTDYMAWHLVLNETMNGGTVSERYASMVLKRSWSRARWLLYSWRHAHSVQALVPALDLRQAKAVWVRNEKARRKLVAMGFANVQVKRLPVQS